MDEISKLFPGLREQKTSLEHCFYRCLDGSAILSGVLHGPASRVCPKVGEGRHFQCFRMPGRSGLDLAVHLAKPVFLKSEMRQRQLWKEDLKRLRSLDHPLIPPMEVFEEKDFFAYVQPYCEKEQELTPVIKSALLDLQESLASIGLVLDDYPQLRSCQGHPFVIDFSDLKRREGRGFKL